MLIVASGLAMAVSGMFDAMLYGADRAIQVVILMSLMQRAVRLAAAETAAHWAAPPLAPDVSDTPVAPLRRAET
jgi:multisubunit Na+/H+ antiporter MnhC subunit